MDRPSRKKDNHVVPEGSEEKWPPSVLITRSPGFSASFATSGDMCRVLMMTISLYISLCGRYSSKVVDEEKQSPFL